MQRKHKHTLPLRPPRQLLGKKQVRSLSVPVPSHERILLPVSEGIVVKAEGAPDVCVARYDDNARRKAFRTGGEHEREDRFNEEEMPEVVPRELQLMSVFTECVCVGCDGCVCDYDLV